METLLVRIKSYDVRRGHVLRRFIYAGIKFTEERGWVRVEKPVADWLRTVHQLSGNPHSPLAFDVCTDAEAKALEAAQAEESNGRRRAIEDIPLTIARPYGPGVPQWRPVPTREEPPKPSPVPTGRSGEKDSPPADSSPVLAAAPAPVPTQEESPKPSLAPSGGSDEVDSPPADSSPVLAAAPAPVPTQEEMPKPGPAPADKGDEANSLQAPPDFFLAHPIFSHEEYLAAQGAEADADSLLAQSVVSGRLLRVRRGLYATVPVGTEVARFRVEPFLLASKLTPDAALAYHAALQFQGKAYSTWHRFAVLTRAHLRPLSFQESEFVGVQPPQAVRHLPDFGGGIISVPYAGSAVRVTTLERTLVDVLDVPELGGGWEEVWRSLEMVECLDLEAVVTYALRLDSALTAARVGLFLEQHREALHVEEKDLRPLEEHAPRQPRYLDGTREPGQLIKPWNLVVPERVLNRTWEERVAAPS